MSAAERPAPCHAVVTGAQGFIGKALVDRLLQGGLHGRPLRRLTLMDLAFSAPHADPRVVQVAGSIASAETRRRAFDEPVDGVFHLASVPGGAAEQDYALGRSINLDATLGLLDDLRQLPPRSPSPAFFVYASSVAVYGEAPGTPVDEDTPAAPALSYGAHKLVGEIMVADASRRGWIRGCSLRLPGVVARPGDGAGLISAFMSELFWRLEAGRPIQLPVGPEGTAWWISVGRCVDNLLHAASLGRGTHLMPALWLSMTQVVDALARRFGADRRALVSYQPDARVQRLFASYPPLHTPRARLAGLRDDGDADALVVRAMA